MASDRAKRQMTHLESMSQTESVVYRPSGGDARTISALVDRPGADDLAHGQAAAPEVRVLNDAADGIDATELDVGADTISVAERVGGTAAARRFNRIIEQDSDWLAFTVQ